MEKSLNGKTNFAFSQCICIVSLAKRQCQMMCKSDPSSQETFHYLYRVTYPLSQFLSSAEGYLLMFLRDFSIRRTHEWNKKSEEVYWNVSQNKTAQYPTHDTSQKKKQNNKQKTTMFLLKTNILLHLLIYLAEMRECKPSPLYVSC